MTFDEAEETLIDWSVGPWELLDEPRRQAVALLVLLREVGNGGWSQYLYNAEPEHLSRAEAGAAAAALPQVEALVRQVLSTVGPQGVPAEQERRAELLESLPEDTFDELDDRLIALEGDIEAALGRLVDRISSS